MAELDMDTVPLSLVNLEIILLHFLSFLRTKEVKLVFRKMLWASLNTEIKHNLNLTAVDFIMELLKGKC